MSGQQVSECILEWNKEWRSVLGIQKDNLKGQFPETKTQANKPRTTK